MDGADEDRVESAGNRAISSEVLTPGAAGRILPAGRPSWFGRSMTTSLHPGGPLVVLNDVRLTLGSAAGPVNILRGISLEILAGETVSIVGPSGSGKSTLLMVLGGLERPSSGEVWIDAVDIGRLDEDGLARFRLARIGIVFQSFHLLPTMTALENVAIPLELAGRSDAFVAAADALETVGLGRRLAHYPSQLSGGEQQRVAIARAFIAEPKLLLADEPTGNLDGATGDLVIDCLFEQHTRHGTTLLLVTHDPAIAERCGRQVRLMDGRIVEDRCVARNRLTAVQRAL
jgi:putative ABC transport system ATP-binding protein